MRMFALPAQEKLSTPEAVFGAGPSPTGPCAKPFALGGEREADMGAFMREKIRAWGGHVGPAALWRVKESMREKIRAWGGHVGPAGLRRVKECMREKIRAWVGRVGPAALRRCGA